MIRCGGRSELLVLRLNEMTTTATSSITPAELERMPNASDFELVNGQLVERHKGAESSAVAAAIAAVLIAWNKRIRAGHVFTTDCGFQCFADAPDKVRRPDVTFVRSDRLPGGRPPAGYVQIAPDLAVEVLSPGDLAYEIDEKVSEYLAAGFRLIWVVNPRTQTVRMHRQPGGPLGPISSLGVNDEIKGEEVLQGFECPVSEFFDI